MSLKKLGGDKPFDIDTFAPKLQALCASAMADNRSPDAAAEVIEKLIAALAFTISLATGGDRKLMSNMIAGVEGYLSERCADYERAGQVLGHIRKAR
jgi:hypothetical protein